MKNKLEKISDYKLYIPDDKTADVYSYLHNSINSISDQFGSDLNYRFELIYTLEFKVTNYVKTLL